MHAGFSRGVVRVADAGLCSATELKSIRRRLSRIVKNTCCRTRPVSLTIMAIAFDLCRS